MSIITSKSLLSAEPLRSDRWGGWFPFYTLLSLVAIPGIAYGLLGHFEQFNERLIAVAASICGLLILWALAVLHWRSSWLLTSLLALIAPFNALFVITYGWPIDANALALLTETNIKDAGEMVRGTPWALWLVPLLPMIAAVWAWKKPLYMPSKATASKIIIVALIISSLMYWTVRMASAVVLPKDSEFTFPEAVIGQAVVWRGSYPTGAPWVLMDFVRERSALKSAFEFNQSFRFGLDRKPQGDQRQVYVLVIGESARGDRLHLNGYERNTTPQLSARDDVTSFSRMYSPWAFSRLAVPLLITRKPPTSTAALYDEASIVTAFKEAGFHTTWLSLKPSLGFHASPVSVHAFEADETRFLTASNSHQPTVSDLDALPALDQALAKTDKNLLIVLHTLGSHYSYSDRYSTEFASFAPDRPDEGRAELFNSADRQYLSNAYDNSLLLTDKLLSEIIKRLEKLPGTESMMYYSSDHGEALFDDCRNFSGHGHVAYHTQSVAAVFWASPAFREKHPDKIVALNANSARPLDTSMTFDTLADLAELPIPGWRANLSFARLDPDISDIALEAEHDRDHACQAVLFPNKRE